LEFNSLDAQREACEAYIKSQAGAGWKAVSQRYDDPAYSGGSLERPAVQRLLRDIEDGKIDVVVVYKIDRLTRSLADFAKLVEVFDAKSVSFVAVTQQFNTTTSMGRLTLNVLLSFAQFERELSSERVRDKVAASRKKGKWMGGTPPLGYATKDKRLAVNQEEAEIVRHIFRRYLGVKSLQGLIIELNEKNFRPTRRADRRPITTRRFTYGALAYLLKNRIYIGEAGHKGNWFAGEHEAIVDRELFEGVQLLIKNNSVVRKQKRTQNCALLTGLLFDDKGNRFSPSYTTKRGVRYRFYVNSALLRGRPTDAGSVRRISATELEAVVSNALREQFGQSDSSISSLIQVNIERIVLKQDALEIAMKPANNHHGGNNALRIAWRQPQAASATVIKTDERSQSKVPDRKLIHALTRAHMWLDLLSTSVFKSVAELAASINMDERSVGNGLRLAFISPEITEAILSGSSLRIRNLAKIQSHLPLSWEEQKGIVNL
jgi:DNA invertase Pin-like site-specific DNA recombinase